METNSRPERWQPLVGWPATILWFIGAIALFGGGLVATVSDWSGWTPTDPAARTQFHNWCGLVQAAGLVVFGGFGAIFALVHLRRHPEPDRVAS
jgi:TRAP-type C4-dicarboxylate transport system permease small subunit